MDRSDADGCDCSAGNSACAPECSDASRPDPRNVMSYDGCGGDEDHGSFSGMQTKLMHCLVSQRMEHARDGADRTDRDGDGFGANEGDVCDSLGRDCDDGDALISPAGIEACTGRDDDCDGQVDEGEVCRADLRIPAIHVTNLQVLSGDRGFGGNGPILSAEARVRAGDGQVHVTVCVDAMQTNRDSHGRRCVEQTYPVPFRRFRIDNEADLQLWAVYVDTDHDWDNAKSERQHPNVPVRHGAAVSARCLGDTRGDDLCADGRSCTGCIFEFQPARLRAVY